MRLELALEQVRIGPLPLEEEARAVPKRRGLEVHRLERQALGARRWLGERLTADVERDAADELQEAGSARVDHPGLPEDRELLRRPRERLLAGVDDPGQRLSRVESLVARLLRPVGERASHGQDRSLLRLAHGRVAGVCGRAECGRLILPSAPAPLRLPGRSGRG